MTTAQLDLFDVRATSVPLVRPSDPDTSHAAARPTAKRHEQIEMCKRLLRDNPDGLTDWELWKLTGLPERERQALICRRREAGAVKSDRRRLTPTGSSAVVWVLP